MDSWHLFSHFEPLCMRKWYTNNGCRLYRRVAMISCQLAMHWRRADIDICLCMRCAMQLQYEYVYCKRVNMRVNSQMRSIRIRSIFSNKHFSLFVPYAFSVRSCVILYPYADAHNVFNFKYLSYGTVAIRIYTTHRYAKYISKVIAYRNVTTVRVNIILFVCFFCFLWYSIYFFLGCTLCNINMTHH